VPDLAPIERIGFAPGDGFDLEDLGAVISTVHIRARRGQDRRTGLPLALKDKNLSGFDNMGNVFAGKNRIPEKCLSGRDSDCFWLPLDQGPTMQMLRLGTAAPAKDMVIQGDGPIAVFVNHLE